MSWNTSLLLSKAVLNPYSNNMHFLGDVTIDGSTNISGGVFVNMPLSDVLADGNSAAGYSIVDVSGIETGTATIGTAGITTGNITTGNISTANISTRLRVNGADTSDNSLVKISSTGNTTTDYLKIYSAVPSTTPDNLLLFRGEPNSGSLNGVLYLGDAFQNQSDANYRIKLDTAGNCFINNGNNSYLGLGTDSPECKLHLNRTDSVSTNFRMSNSVNTAGTDFVCNSSGGFDMANRLSGSNSYIRFLTNGATERMRILNTGNVGINTTNPTTNLDVNGNVKGNYFYVGTPTGVPAGTGMAVQVPSGQCTYHLQSGTANASFVARTTGPCYVGTGTAHPFSLVSNNSIYTTLDTAGNFGIGIQTPGEKLDVAGNALIRNNLDVSGNLNVGGKLSYDTNSLYTELTGSSYTATRVLTDYTPGMTDTFHYIPPSAGLPTYNLIYKISRQMIEKGGELNICLVVDNSTYAGNIDLTVQTYNEVGGAFEGLNLDTTITPMVKTSSQLISGNYAFEYIKIICMANNGSGDPCIVVKRMATNT